MSPRFTSVLISVFASSALLLTSTADAAPKTKADTAKEKAAEEEAAKQKAADEEAAKQKAADEEAAKQKAAEEEAAKEKTDKDPTADKEKADKEAAAAAICPGDSGGPAVSSEGGEILGVISASAMDGDERTRDRSEFVRVDRWRTLFAYAALVSSGTSPTELPPIECK